MAFVVLEIVSLCVRIFMATHLTGMRIKDYYKNVFLPTMVIILVPLTVALIPYFLMSQTFLRLVIVSSIYGLSFVVLMFRFAFEENQRTAVISRLFNKLKSK